MADYAKEMKALEGMMREEEGREATERANYSSGETMANMMTPLTKPRAGAAEIMLDIKPEDRSEEMKTAWTSGSKGRLDTSTAKQKRLLEQYKALQNAKTDGDTLALKEAQLAQEQSNSDKDRQLRYAELKNKASAVSFTPGEKARDITFAKQIAEYDDAGGQAEVLSQLDTLKLLNSNIAKGAIKTGGPMGIARSAIPWSDVSISKQQVQLAIQNTMRPILGAQFTEKEGKRVIEATFSPSASPEENARRITSLINKLTAMHEAKMKSMELFAKHGTLSKRVIGQDAFSVPATNYKSIADEIIRDVNADSQTQGMVAQAGSGQDISDINQGAAITAEKPDTIEQDGYTYTLNQETGEYE